MINQISTWKAQHFDLRKHHLPGVAFQRFNCAVLFWERFMFSSRSDLGLPRTEPKTNTGRGNSQWNPRCLWVCSKLTVVASMLARSLACKPMYLLILQVENLLHLSNVQELVGQNLARDLLALYHQLILKGEIELWFRPLCFYLLILLLWWICLKMFIPIPVRTSTLTYSYPITQGHKANFPPSAGHFCNILQITSNINND